MNNKFPEIERDLNELDARDKIRTYTIRLGIGAFTWLSLLAMCITFIALLAGAGPILAIQIGGIFVLTIITLALFMGGLAYLASKIDDGPDY